MGHNRLQDKIAFITGGGIGIGKAIARAYADEGATVIIASRNRANLDATVSELRAKGATALAIPMDITREQEVVDAVSKAIEQFGRIDILVNNSGIGGPTCNVWELALEDWNQIINVDLTGSMLCAREVLKHMVPAGNGGIIINIGAEGGRGGDGRSGYPMRSGYCCAKMGVIGLTETLAQECGPYNIRVNCISAAATRGDRWMRVMQAKADALNVPVEEVLASLFKNVSLGRPAEEYELANVAVFLASDESSAMTGQVVVAHCGLHW